VDAAVAAALPSVRSAAEGAVINTRRALRRAAILF
jgi:hypothetical protein